MFARGKLGNGFDGCRLNSSFMNERVIHGIEKKTGVTDIVGLLADRLSGSELSSLLLAVYERKTGKMEPAELLAQYRGNRLVQPADVDMLAVTEAGLLALRFLRDRGFSPVELSPVAALGTCSVVAAVSQDKVVSAVRNTEVLADATNALALHIADLRKAGADGRAGEAVARGAAANDRSGGADGVLRFCTVHRHLRTQPLLDKRFRPHFVIGCAVSAGKDMGNFRFELEALREHVGGLVSMLREVFGVSRFRLVLKKRSGYGMDLLERAEAFLRVSLEEVVIELESSPPESAYYRGVQFKLYIGDKNWEIADGGFVDWTQKLLGNKKERMMISGFGLELLYRMREGLL